MKKMIQKNWDDEEVFQDGDSFFARLFEDIDQARYSIHLETYIFEQDSLGDRLLTALKNAASRGVLVRVLMDGIGSLPWTFDQARAFAKQGIEIRFYHPLPWQVKKSDILRFFRMRYFLERLFQLNRRNHRKSCVIDYQIAYVGGMNVSSRHLKSLVGEDAWKDCAVRVKGSAVYDLIVAFEKAWYGPFERIIDKLESNQEVSTHTISSLLRLNDSRSKRRRIYRDLIGRIMKAKARVWITTPYLVPEFLVLRALRSAARKGIDVRILVPFKNDVFFMRHVNQASYRYLLRAGVQIFEYIPSILHSKIFIIDQWGTVGSTNLNHRSLFQDLEVDAVLTHPNSIQSLESWYLNDLKVSRQIQRRALRKRYGFTEFIQSIVLYFKRWL
jgi:cardiolipin synthase A/B